MTFETWHISADGTTVRKLGDPGRRLDRTGQWRPIDRNNPGESPNRIRHEMWQDLRGVDGERPLAELYQRHAAGEMLTGRDGERVLADSVQVRAAFGVPVPKRSDLAERYAERRDQGYAPAVAARLVADEDNDAGIRVTPQEVWRAVRKARTNPRPRAVAGVFTWDEHAAKYVPYVPIADSRDHRRELRDQRRGQRDA